MFAKLISGLSDRENRFWAASKVAEWLDCSYLVIFIEDPEIKILLPAPGFPQTLPDGKAWLEFVKKTQSKDCHSGSLPFPQSHNSLAATGISGPYQSVAILLGGTPSEEKLSSLRDILPILVVLFKQEQAFLSAEIRVALANKSAVKAEKLANTIDNMRSHLKDALVKQEKGKRDIEDLMNKKDEFMNVASHELKTPITSMKAYLQILSRLLPKGQNVLADDFIHKANLQVGKLTELINDLLDVTKIQAGQMIYKFKDLDLSEVVRDAVSQVQLASPSHVIIINNNPKALVHGERNRLEQVVQNFLSNAIKYSPHSDQVVIGAEITDGEIRVSVKDFGIGIPKDLQPLVFDRFFRVQESSRQFSGLGLGLYISAEIIKRHSGKVGVTSNGNGSEFFFQIPIIQES